MSEEPAPRRRPSQSLVWRIVPIALALGGASLVSYLYGTHPVDLLVSIPAALDQARSGVVVRVTRSDGKLVLQVEQNTRAAEGHTIVIPAHLPRGKFHVEAWPQGGGVHLGADVTYDAEDALEVPLSAR